MYAVLSLPCHISLDCKRNLYATLATVQSVQYWLCIACETPAYLCWEFGNFCLVIADRDMLEVVFIRL